MWFCVGNKSENKFVDLGTKTGNKLVELGTNTGNKLVDLGTNLWIWEQKLGTNLVIREQIREHVVLLREQIWEQNCGSGNKNWEQTCGSGNKSWEQKLGTNTGDKHRAQKKKHTHWEHTFPAGHRRQIFGPGAADSSPANSPLRQRRPNFSGLARRTEIFAAPAPPRQGDSKILGAARWLRESAAAAQSWEPAALRPRAVAGLPARCPTWSTTVARPRAEATSRGGPPMLWATAAPARWLRAGAVPWVGGP